MKKVFDLVLKLLKLTFMITVSIILISILIIMVCFFIFWLILTPIFILIDFLYDKKEFFIRWEEDIHEDKLFKILDNLYFTYYKLIIRNSFNWMKEEIKPLFK